METGVARRLVGREAELETVARVARFEAGPRVLVLEGEPGIGKTALWTAGIENARAVGAAVLVARAAESEATFAFAGVADLLRDLSSGVLDGLPPPQRRSLEAALLLADAADGDVELHAVSTGFAAVLRALAEERPLLVSVDDVQWLDRASAAVLGFALRRTDERVRFLLTQRLDAEPVADAERLGLAPLSLGALQRLLLAHGASLSAIATRRIHEASGGNPYYALELADAFVQSDRGAARLGELPLPESLAALLEKRVARLPVDGERAVLAASLLAEPTYEAVLAVAGEDGLEAAEAAGLLVGEGPRLRLSHPLVGTAARARASAPERRRLHLALAELVHSDEEQARHLALGSQPPDEEIAATLERAAARADRRGAAAAGAELAREACLFSAAGPDRRRRVLLAGRLHMRSGEFAAGLALLEPELPSFPPGPERALARFLQLDLSRHDHELEAWEAVLEEAEGQVRAEILTEIAFQAGAASVARLDEAAEWAREAVGLAKDRRLHLAARQSEAFIAALRGDRRPAQELAAAEADDRLPVVSSPARLLAMIASWRGEVPEARRLLVELEELARDRDEWWAGLVILHHHVELAARVGDRRLLAAAVERLEPAVSSFAPLRDDSLPRHRAMLAALAGDVTAARRAAAAAPAQGWQALEARRATGLAELFAGDAAAAAADLGAAHEHLAEAGVEEPGTFPLGADLAEALVRLRRLDEAERVVARLEAAAAAQEHPWALAVGARARGLLLDAQGDAGGAEAALRDALARHAELELPLDEARTKLALGSLLRRQRRLRDARGLLDEAAKRFETLDVVPLARRALDELARVPGRRSAGGLTPTEERVAALVAEGLTNREAAASLVVTVKVVERHLTRIYAKLGVRTRAELARRVGESGGIPRLPSPPARS